MPTLAEFIRAEKTDLDEGNWQIGHISPSAFPLSKAKKKHFKYGPEYKWRLVKFDCLGHRCRVLILFNANKLICRSTFAVECGNDLAVLCTHEYHADHPGWHCHLVNEPHDKVAPGVIRSGQRRWPKARSVHRQSEFGLSEISALSHVAARYRFQAQGGLI
jgi:hypothetical protein